MKLFNTAMAAWPEHQRWMNVLTLEKVEGYFLMGSRRWCPERVSLFTDWDFCALIPTGITRTTPGLYGKLYGVTNIKVLEPGDYVKEGPMALLDVARLTFFDRFTVDVAVETDKERFDLRDRQQRRLATADKEDFYNFMGEMWGGFTGAQRYRLACKYILGENAV